MNIDFTTIIDYIGTFAFAISQAIRLVRGIRGRSRNSHRGRNDTRFDAGVNSFLDAPTLLSDCYRAGLVIRDYVRETSDPAE